MRRIISLLFLVSFAAPAAAAEPVGFFASLEGDVQVSTNVAPGVDHWLAARQDGPLEIGDRIRTALGASARIVLVDDTLIHVDEDTELRIESFHVGSAATRERSVLRQTRGRLRTVVGDAFGGSTRLEIHTPSAVVGVKGTDFETSDDSMPGSVRYRMCCHGGAIDVSNPHGSASPPPGQCVHAEAGKAPGDPFHNPDPPFAARPESALDGRDFTEEVLLTPPPASPGDFDLLKDDDLRVIELPEAATPGPRGLPSLIFGPLN